MKMFTVPYDPGYENLNKKHLMISMLGFLLLIGFIVGMYVLFAVMAQKRNRNVVA